MKKLIVLCLAVILVFGMSMTAFAAPNGFVVSPGGKPAPDVEDFDPKDEDCTAELIITPYSEKDTLPEELEEFFEKAYEEIVDADDLTDLTDDLKDIAEKLDIDPEDLVVSDLFNLHTEGCDNHEDHIDCDIVLEADNLKNFVGLVHLDEDGNWKIIDGAKVKDGTHLCFTSNAFGPYAIIVNKGKTSPQTQDNSNMSLYLITMVACAAVMLPLWRKVKN